MRVAELLGAYLVLLRGEGPSALAAEVRHIVRNEHGGSLQTPIGWLAAYAIAAEAETRDYWRAELLVRADVGRRLWDERLPDALAEWLLAETACAEPLVLEVHEGRSIGFVTRGELWPDEE